MVVRHVEPLFIPRSRRRRNIMRRKNVHSAVEHMGGRVGGECAGNERILSECRDRGRGRKQSDTDSGGKFHGSNLCAVLIVMTDLVNFILLNGSIIYNASKKKQVPMPHFIRVVFIFIPLRNKLVHIQTFVSYSAAWQTRGQSKIRRISRPSVRTTTISGRIQVRAWTCPLSVIFCLCRRRSCLSPCPERPSCGGCR